MPRIENRDVSEDESASGASAWRGIGSTPGLEAPIGIDEGREDVGGQVIELDGLAVGLRGLGLLREAGKDEFDTIGLGERRSMDDYSPEGPVRLRGAAAAEANAEPARGLPVWVVALVIAGAIGLGVLLAVMR